MTRWIWFTLRHRILYALEKDHYGYYREGKLECEEMPHSETIQLMEQMDTLRGQWGIRYPFE